MKDFNLEAPVFSLAQGGLMLARMITSPKTSLPPPPKPGVLGGPVTLLSPSTYGINRTYRLVGWVLETVGRNVNVIHCADKQMLRSTVVEM